MRALAAALLLALALSGCVTYSVAAPSFTWLRGCWSYGDEVLHWTEPSSQRWRGEIAQSHTFCANACTFEIGREADGIWRLRACQTDDCQTYRLTGMSMRRAVFTREGHPMRTQPDGRLTVKVLAMTLIIEEERPGQSQQLRFVGHHARCP